MNEIEEKRWKVELMRVVKKNPMRALEMLDKLIRSTFIPDEGKRKYQAIRDSLERLLWKDE